MLNIPKIYNDPIISRKRLGTSIQPFKNIVESVTIEKHYALLTEIPNRYDKVKVTGLNRNFHETEDGLLDENTFRVDYTNGIVYFHSSLSNRTLHFEYTGEGVYLFPDSRVYLTGDKGFPNVRDKFADVDRAILVERHRIDEQITTYPQPSEVIDTRIDYNGSVFSITKDRIDAEQRKIEEAYVDAKGKKHDSLKIRIDSLQLATEKSIDDLTGDIYELDSQIKIIPGQINLKVSELRKSVEGDMTLLESEIDMLPDLISLSVRELRESIDGDLSTMMSIIDIQAGMIDLRVTVDDVVSSINLSKEGVRIGGERIWLDGETRIDNAVIKSAHIDSISADKITAGSIDASKIRIHGGSSTNYTSIDGATFESRGRYTRSWRGEVSTNDVRIRIHNGLIRARNDHHERSIYYSDFGISTFADGSGEYIHDIEKTSGTIEFFSYRYGSPRGITVYSGGTFGINTRDIVLDPSRNIEFRAGGMIDFMGTNVRGTAIGVREPNTNFYIGASGTRNGELRVTDKNFYNSGNPRYLDVRARYYRGRAIVDTGRSSYIYMGSDLGVRVTSRGINTLNSIIYRPIQASAFQVRSSRDSKENIAKTSEKGLDVINELNVVNFNYIGSNEKKVGFIAEDSPRIANEESKFVDLNDLTTYLTLAVQELTAELNELKQKIQS